MGAGAFFGGLASGFGGSILDMQDKEHADDLAKRRMRVEILTHALDRISDPSLQAEAFNLMEEIASGKTKTKGPGLAGLLGLGGKDSGDQKIQEFLGRPRQSVTEPERQVPSETMAVPERRMTVLPPVPDGASPVMRSQGTGTAEVPGYTVPAKTVSVRGPFTTPSERAAGKVTEINAEETARGRARQQFEAEERTRLIGEAKQILGPNASPIDVANYVNNKVIKDSADTSLWQTLPPAIAKTLGLPEGQKVPPNELDSYVRMVEAAQKDNTLHFETNTDEITGDVTTRGFDSRTGAVKFAHTSKGEARKRPPHESEGAWVPLTDEQGVITKFYNPKTGESKDPPVEGARKSGLSTVEKEKRATRQEMIRQGMALMALGEKYQKHIGVIKGRLDDAARKTLGVDEGINDLFRISDNLADQLLRARSGAAITETEFVRLRALMPDPRSPYKKFKSDLRLFLEETRSMYKSATGKDAPGVIPPVPGTEDNVASSEASVVDNLVKKYGGQ
jgi:hypothetical protein